MNERHVMKKFMLHLIVASSLITPSLFSQQSPHDNPESDRQVTISLEHKKALEQRLNDFSQNYLATLQPQELQYFANLIYFSYALASFDAHVRTKAQEILFCAKATQAGLLNYKQTTQIKEYLVKTLNTIDGAVNAQIEHLKAWQQCCAFEDTLEQNSPLLKAIEIFKDTIEIEIGILAHENEEAFNAKLDQGSKTFIEVGESLTMVGNTYKGLLKNASPLPSVPQDKQIAKIGVASRTASNVDEQCWKAIDAALQITEVESALQVLSIEIAGMYYQTAHKQLAQHDAHYRTFMYNAQGLIPVEQRTQELPLIQ